MITEPDPAGARIVEQHLAGIAAALGRADAVRDDVLDELRDCLLTAMEHHVAHGMAPAAAARAAVRDHGDPAHVTPEVVADLTASRARATAVAILRSGPLAAMVWTLAMIAPPPVPGAVTAAPWRAAMVWLGPVVVLAAACAVVAYGTASRVGAPPPAASRTAAVAAATACAAADLATLAYCAVLAVAGGRAAGIVIVLIAWVSCARIGVVGMRVRSLWPRMPVGATP